jgi:hypothetical protein
MPAQKYRGRSDRHSIAPNRKRLAVLAVERVCLYLVANQSNGQSTFYSVPLALNWNPLTSADSTDQNPVVPQ